MATILTDNQNYKDIADAIRAKGVTGAFLPAQMANAIQAIPSGDTENEDGIIAKTITTYSNDRVKTIGQYAFYLCDSLTTVSFPACTAIRSNAFASCSRLATVSFPACTFIDENAFSGCSKLFSIYILTSSVPCLSNANAFYSTPISVSSGGVYGSIIVKASMLEAFKAATNWKIYSSRFSVWNEID